MQAWTHYSCRKCKLSFLAILLLSRHFILTYQEYKIDLKWIGDLKLNGSNYLWKMEQNSPNITERKALTHCVILVSQVSKLRQEFTIKVHQNCMHGGLWRLSAKLWLIIMLCKQKCTCACKHYPTRASWGRSRPPRDVEGTRKQVLCLSGRSDSRVRRP